eukprot:16045-Eustigmatos_ZCMA.PRE.1
MIEHEHLSIKPALRREPALCQGLQYPGKGLTSCAVSSSCLPGPRRSLVDASPMPSCDALAGSTSARGRMGNSTE